MSELYVVTGATGHVGGIIANGLLDAGKKVRVVSRHKNKLSDLKAKGADALVGDLKDTSFVERAFHGADAAFVMVPPDMTIQVGFRDYQNTVANNQAQAVKKAGIKWVVTLSSLGGNLDKGNGPVAGLHDMEVAFDELTGVNVLHLRPGFFMENLFSNIGMIKETGVLGSPALPNTPLSMICTEDIGKAGLAHLLSCDFKGHEVNELLGPKQVTMAEVAHVLGEAIGNPELPYVQFNYEDAQAGMIQMGISEELSSLYIEMYKGLNDGSIKPLEGWSDKTRTPTTITQFAKSWFAPAYKG